MTSEFNDNNNDNDDKYNNNSNNNNNDDEFLNKITPYIFSKMHLISYTSGITINFKSSSSVFQHTQHVSMFCKG